MQVRDVRETDLEDVLALNEASVPHVNSIPLDDMRWFMKHAHYFRVAAEGDTIAGFLVGLGPGSSYESPNYRYFAGKYESFGYVDRVAVSTDFRRRGVASQLYDDYAATLRGYVPVMTCEVNIRPPAEASMLYHERHGFQCVATQETEGGKKEVALMEKRL